MSGEGDTQYGPVASWCGFDEAGESTNVTRITQGVTRASGIHFENELPRGTETSTPYPDRREIELYFTLHGFCAVRGHS